MIFSFSGLKTAVINYLHQCEQKNEEYKVGGCCSVISNSRNRCAGEKSFKLTIEENMDKIVLAGGVAANSGLRNALEKRGAEE